VLSVFSRELAIDLGTANTFIYVKGEGIVLNEPSVVAIKRDDRGGNKILAVGKEAKMMLGRTPGNIVAIRPMMGGVIGDFEIAEEMLRCLITKAQGRRRFFKARAIIAVPCGITQIEKKAVQEAAESAGAREVFFIEEPVAAAIGAGLPVSEPKGSMIVDIGAGTTEVAVISLGGVVDSFSVRVAGDEMDFSIQEYIKRKYQLMIGLSTAETVKLAIGNASPENNLETAEVKGRDLATGVPKVLTIGSDEIREAISDKLNSVARAAMTALERVPPELAADLVERGIMLAGGGALLKNMDLFLSSAVKLPVTIAEDPLSAAVVGAGKVLADLRILRDLEKG